MLHGATLTVGGANSFRNSGRAGWSAKALWASIDSHSTRKMNAQESDALGRGSLERQRG